MIYKIFLEEYNMNVLRMRLWLLLFLISLCKKVLLRFKWKYGCLRIKYFGRFNDENIMI